MLTIDDIILSSDISEFTLFIKKDIMSEIKIFYHVYVSLIKLKISQATYIAFLNTMIENKFDVVKIQDIKKMVMVLNTNNLIIAYQYTLLNMVHSELKNRLDKFIKIMLNSNLKHIHNNDINNTINNILLYINSFAGKFTIKPSDSQTTQNKYNVMEMWELENKTEMINRLILLVDYFDISIIQHIGIDIVSYDDVLNYDCKYLQKYYNSVIKKINKYFATMQIIVTTYDNVADLISKILIYKTVVNVDKYIFILKSNVTLSENKSDNKPKQSKDLDKSNKIIKPDIIDESVDKHIQMLELDKTSESIKSDIINESNNSLEQSPTLEKTSVSDQSPELDQTVEPDKNIEIITEI